MTSTVLPKYGGGEVPSAISQCDSHEVKFYECHSDFINDVSSFLLSGLHNNEVVLAIVARQHLKELQKDLKDRLGEWAYSNFLKQGMCTILDAESTLERISSDGWPDEEKFNQVIGNSVAQLKELHNRPVRAFGEMVALLCAQGKPDAAIQLEQLWNALAKKYSFSLLCGYPLNAFASEVDGITFDTICNLHTRVHPVKQGDIGQNSVDSGSTVAKLQQRTRALESELEKYQKLEQALKERDKILTEQTLALKEAQVRLEQEIRKREANEENLLHIQYVQGLAQKISHLGSWEIDLETGLLQCSDEFFRICGLEPQSREIDFEFTQSIVHPEDQAAAKSAVKAALIDNKPYRVEKRIIRPDGTIRHILSQGEVILMEQKKPKRGIGAFLDITELRQTEEALRQSHEELRHLAAHQEKLKEEERKRIARELHDELGGLLTGIKAYLSILVREDRKDSEQATELLIETSGIADMAMKAVQRIVNDLRPSVLDQFGVWAAIRWYVERIVQRNDLTCKCEIDDTAEGLSLDVEHSTLLFRICQEALTNVIRHSQASVVTIRASCESEILTIEIEDNGKGFDAAQLKGRTSWGISGMHERALQFKGKLSIQSAAGAGAVVRLSLQTGGILDE
ncbi:MEDS domain-containing protein [Oxalobacteraceae bacterium R-40]|uniref:MEDS domain-containing protein n=1 Tax=Keguizhuia sedimenti TaxID=3064264 RepID=A0ABU1BS77_9BURK|nr:MEDS domain-containing protein [Oxalobacteraceae bacterium R-40]